MKLLSEPEKLRYQRHLLLEEIGEEGQTRIRNARVLVVGAGGLGCPVIQYLTAAGVGKLGILDNDQVEISNLQRQVFYGFNDIGKLKSIVASTRMRRMNSFVDVVMINRRLVAGNALEILEGYDLVVDCTDNLATRYAINDASILLGIPMVHGAVHKFQGQVSVFNYLDGPSYRCLHPEQESGAPAAHPAIGIFHVLPGIIGLLQVNEVMKLITGIGEPLSGKLLVYQAKDSQTWLMEIERKPENFIRQNLIERPGAIKEP